MLNDIKARFRPAKVHINAEAAKHLGQEKGFWSQKKNWAGKNLYVSRILLILQVRKGESLPALKKDVAGPGRPARIYASFIMQKRGACLMPRRRTRPFLCTNLKKTCNGSPAN